MNKEGRSMRLLKWIPLAFILILPLSQAKEIENILNNHDFELGTQGWKIWVEDKANATAVMKADNSERVKGKQSLLIEITKAGIGKRVELHQNPISLKKGQKLTYAFWAKADPARPAVMICNHRAPPWTSYGSKNIFITEDWQEFWITFIMPVDDNIGGIYVELRDNTKGKVWFDDFRLFEGDYVEDPEIGAGEEKGFSVNPKGKLPWTWASLKEKRRVSPLLGSDGVFHRNTSR